MEKAQKVIGNFEAKDLLLLMGGAAALYLTYKQWGDDKKLLKDVVQILAEEKRGRAVSFSDNKPERDNSLENKVPNMER